MTLPKIQYPTFTITIPSTKKKAKFRPFTVGEEKLLLMGQQSDEPKDMYDAIKQVINNCAIDNIDLSNLAPFDFDYIFIKLRAQSVSNVVEIKYLDPEDNEKYEVKVNLDDVEVQFPEAAADPIIQCDENIKVKLRYPTMKMMDEIMAELEGMKEVDPSKVTDKLILKAIDMIIAGDEIYPVNEISDEELLEFVESLPGKAYKSIRKFFEATPQVRHTVTYKTNKGTDRSIELNGLRDFFMF
jgi:hypothetical protein